MPNLNYALRNCAIVILLGCTNLYTQILPKEKVHGIVETISLNLLQLQFHMAIRF